MHRLPEILLNIDAHQPGVGGNNSWGEVPLENGICCAKDDHYRYAFRISREKQWNHSTWNGFHIE